jgi:hypothetical protein
MAAKIVANVFPVDDAPWTIGIRAQIDVADVLPAEPTPDGLLAETVLEVPVRLRVRYRADANGHTDVLSAEEA